jgi:hypothetical protein
VRQRLKHQTTGKFWASYNDLPGDIRELADRNFELLKKRPEALALEREMVFTWVWIGSREDHDRLIG